MHFERDAGCVWAVELWDLEFFQTTTYRVGKNFLQKMDYKFQSSTFFPEQEDC